MNRARQTNRLARKRCCRRGGAYVLVLCLAMLLTVLGLSAISTARIGLRAQQFDSEAAQAVALAESAIELGLYHMTEDDYWRTTYTSAQWSTARPLGDGVIEFGLVDEDDGDLADDASEDVRLYGKACVGDSVRVVSVVVETEEVDTAGSTTLIDDDMESGVGPWASYGDMCDLQIDSSYQHGGADSLCIKNRDSSGSGVAQDITDEVESGQTYDIDLWMMMKDVTDNNVYFGIVVNTVGGATHQFVDIATANNTWTNLTGSVTVNFSGQASSIVFYVLPTESKMEFWLDDVSVVEVSSGSDITQHRPVPGTWRREAALTISNPESGSGSSSSSSGGSSGGGGWLSSFFK